MQNNTALLFAFVESGRMQGKSRFVAMPPQNGEFLMAMFALGFLAAIVVYFVLGLGLLFVLSVGRVGTLRAAEPVPERDGELELA